MFQTQITDISKLQESASLLLNYFPDERVFAFYGTMGAGKTTFIKAICHELGSTDNVTSPSFALINEYTTDSDSLIYHFDFYRIKKLEEAFDLGYEDYFYSGQYCLIEWSEKIEQLLPAHYVKVTISTGENDQREILAEVIRH